MFRLKQPRRNHMPENKNIEVIACDEEGNAINLKEALSGAFGDFLKEQLSVIPAMEMERAESENDRILGIVKSMNIGHDMKEEDILFVCRILKSFADELNEVVSFFTSGFDNEPGIKELSVIGRFLKVKYEMNEMEIEAAESLEMYLSENVFEDSVVH